MCFHPVASKACSSGWWLSGANMVRWVWDFWENLPQLMIYHHFPPLKCVCVCTICKDVKLLICRGTGADLPIQSNEAMAFRWMSGMINHLYLHQFQFSTILISIFVNGNRLSQEPACRFSNQFPNNTIVRFSQTDWAASEPFSEQGRRKLTSQCFPRRVIQFLLSGLLECFCTYDTFHISNSIRYFWASACVCVCVWNIWTDVKLLILMLLQVYFLLYNVAGGCRAQWRLHPTKLSTCAGSRVWSTLCTCYFNISFVIFCDGTWLTQEPPSRYSTHLFYMQFTHGHNNLLFRRNHVADVVWIVRRDHVAEVFCAYLETHRRTYIWNFNSLVKPCGFWFILRLTTLDTLHRFREVPHATPLYI